MKTLIIVESPVKAKSIQTYAGKDYTVVACRGHITDLAKGGIHGLGVDVDNGFKPRYVIVDEQLETLEMLTDKANECDQILIASDPDREGEAIAWHLWSRLEDLRKPIKRIEIHEITKKGVADALKNQRDVNMLLFRSQEARRILDRLVGFMASPFLMNFFGNGLSAGRVQSVVTRMIVDREKEIDAFTPEEYWVIQAALANKTNQSFLSKFAARITNAADANKIKLELEGRDPANDATYIVLNVDADEEKKKPSPPLVTAKLQQIMSKNYSMAADRTMKAAQTLFENGYVTYIRTDSTRANDDAIKGAREWLKENGHAIPKSANTFKNKEAAQDAHECIRPTDLSVAPGSPELLGDEAKVYETIWKCFLASQMTPAIFNTLKVTVGLKSNPKLVLKASGKSLKSAGFLEMFGPVDGTKIDIPDLKTGEELTLFGKVPVTSEQKFTQPPPRYSEFHLLETLEAKNIGRPATTAELLSKICTRNYVEKHGNVFHPTKLGTQITDELVKFFSFMEYDYSALMEDKLDLIASGKVDYINMLSEFFAPFKSEINKAYMDHGAETCIKCKSPMSLRTAKSGDKFWGCSAFPKCKSTKPYSDVGVVVTQPSV